MNKDEDKHIQLLHKCLREMTLLSGICIEYSNFITRLRIIYNEGLFYI